jgi:hypothetical protein
MRGVDSIMQNTADWQQIIEQSRRTLTRRFGAVGSLKMIRFGPNEP